MAVPTHLIPTYPTHDDVIQELSMLGLPATIVATSFDPEDGELWGEAIDLGPDAKRQIIAWCQAEWDRRMKEGGA